ncbi:MAG: hypothetical protein JKY52_00170 [Flavobacteriales bacterium]|nr:hypothetical protein [Flavobacteriales bacterium]
MIFERKRVSKDYLYKAIETLNGTLNRYASVIEIAKYLNCEPEALSRPLHLLVAKGLIKHDIQDGLFFRVVPKHFVKAKAKKTRKVGRPLSKKDANGKLIHLKRYNEYGLKIIQGHVVL